MKKLVVVVVVTAILGIFGCAHNDATVINGVELRGDITKEITVESNESNEANTVHPGDILQYKVYENYKDENDTEAKKEIDDYSVESDNTKVASVNERKSVSISQNAETGDTFTVIITHPSGTRELDYTVKQDMLSTVDESNTILFPDALDVLVNKQRYLPSDYIPKDLVTVDVPTCLDNPEVNQLRKPAADALKKLFDGAKKDGYTLTARSGYRSYQTQNALHKAVENSHGKEYADKYSAIPGQSEHQTGLAMDITSPTVNYQLTGDFGDTPEGKWVKDNAYRYGFVIRYPYGKENIVGYEYEPWHLRYFGIELATEIYQSGLTVEEYFTK